MNQTPSRRTSLEGTRADTLRRLVHALLDSPQRRFDLRDRTLADPTIALLDGWATMADVLEFYDERIRAEGFLGSAIQPESVLALVGLTGVRPRPPVGSSVHLAYLLHPDPSDLAAVLPQGMLTQTVPAQGEQVQTFETGVDLIARPSWNELPLRGGQPKVDLDLGNGTDTLRVAGASHRLAPNDHLLWTRADRAVVLRVVSATPDPAGETADVVVAGLDRKITPTAVSSVSSAGSSETSPPPATDEWSAARVMDGLRTRTREPGVRDPAADPEPAPNFGSATARSAIGATEMFAPRSDAIPRVMAALPVRRRLVAVHHAGGDQPRGSGRAPDPGRHAGRGSAVRHDGAAAGGLRPHRPAPGRGGLASLRNLRPARPADRWPEGLAGDARGRPSLPIRTRSANRWCPSCARLLAWAPSAGSVPMGTPVWRARRGATGTVDLRVRTESLRPLQRNLRGGHAQMGRKGTPLQRVDPPRAGSRRACLVDSLQRSRPRSRTGPCSTGR